jgi:hypothetical protein
MGIDCIEELACFFGYGDESDDVVLLSVLHAEAELKAGNKNDRIDARKLADLLRVGLLSPVYHGESGVRMLKELARSYLTNTKDLTRLRNRIKGLYRAWAIRVRGKKYIRHGTALLVKAN